MFDAKKLCILLGLVLPACDKKEPAPPSPSVASVSSPEASAADPSPTPHAPIVDEPPLRKLTPDDVKILVQSMSDAAFAAYELEQPSEPHHALCLSATPVPGAPPKGTSYQPDPSNGKDFQSGDAVTGWKCLRVDLSRPVPCQFSYTAGRGYRSVKRGNRNVPKEDAEGKAPTGFEVMAECDFDGDGETSVYALTAAIDPKTRQLVSPLEKKHPKIREENPALLFFVDKDGE